MKTKSAFIVASIFICLLGSNSLYALETQSRVEEIVDQIAPMVIEWRRDFHAHPELSNREERTSRVIAERLQEIGVDEIKTGIAHHGVVALIKGKRSGPTVALRADMDALPVTEETGLPFASKNNGVMHACGHDSHTAMVLGTAKVLTQMRDEIHGNVKLIFQPAEEGPPPGEEGGAKLMVKEGVLKDPDVSAIFGLHVWPFIETGKIGYRLGGAFAAVDRFKVEIRGKQVHAALPWDGIDPVVTSANVISGLQTIASRIVDTREPVVVTVGVINGGQRWNIIPDIVILEGTVRTHSPTVRERAKKAFEQIVMNTAKAQGATAEIIYESMAPVVWNDPDLGKQMLPTLHQAVGKENVVEVKPTMGGEDFAFFCQEVPGFYVVLGVRNESIGAVHVLHSPKFMLDEAALPLGLRAMASLAIDYLRGTQ
jgi:amidohydrolase